MKEASTHTYSNAIFFLGKSTPSLMLCTLYTINNSNEPKNVNTPRHLKNTIDICNPLIPSDQAIASSAGSPKYPNVWLTVTFAAKDPNKRIKKKSQVRFFSSFVFIIQ